MYFEHLCVYPELKNNMTYIVEATLAFICFDFPGSNTCNVFIIPPNYNVIIYFNNCLLNVSRWHQIHKLVLVLRLG